MNKNSSKSKISNKIAELERCKETISNMKFIKYMEGDQMNQHTKEDFEECLKFFIKKKREIMSSIKQIVEG
jgi:hypothetical protein